MTPPPRIGKDNGKRRSTLDLAPLERDCMKVLWPMGEGSVRQIRDELAAVRPRAYTTIMTIMDRLTQKGVVTRRKVGRAYFYRANFTAEKVRARAVEQLVEHFFGGSTEALAAHLAGGNAVAPATGDSAAGRAEAAAAAESLPAPPIDEILL